MPLDRREFLAIPALALAAPLAEAAGPTPPWHQRIRRVGQVNFTEHDPAVIDVERWADYWAGAKADAVLVSVTGIVAFYPTSVPYHRPAKFLNGRDLFGECCAAAKKRGIRVIARTSPDLEWREALEPHPEWFMRDREGKFLAHGEEPELFKTCMFGTYYTEHMPAIMREVNARYDIDGIYTNGWPPLGSFPVCYCDRCRRLPPSGTPAYWQEFTDRVVELWKLYDGIAKEKRPDNLYYGNLGGGVGATPNLARVGGVTHWFNCDNQGRGGDDTPIWGCALQGRVCNAVMKGKTSTNVTAGWSTGAVRWRNASKSPEEATMWMDETVATGMVPWYHFIGAETGLGEDRRWQETGRRYFTWLARHDRHLVNRRTVADLGVVIGQSTHLFYKPPAGSLIRQYMDGLYYALLEGRFLFDFVHEDDLGAENLKKYRALILPNVALLSDKQCEQLRAYAESGGSLLATFETGMYDEQNRRRAESGVAGIFGIEHSGPAIGTNGNAFYARIEHPHEILRGFNDTNWIPGAENRLPLKPVDSPVLTVVPGYTAYPPELSYPRQSHTDEPAVVLREKGPSRLVWFSGDVERSLWKSGHTDISRLLQNSVRWLIRGQSPVTIDGDGVVEMFLWETEPGYALHVLNYTNPAMHRGWIRSFFPIGPMKVRVQLPPGKQISRVELLRSETAVPHRASGTAVEFTIPRILDYEIAALT